MNTAYLCLGGNTGDREKHLEAAILLLGARAGDVGACSAFYETQAWGAGGQEPYLNCCVKLFTAFSAQQLMEELLGIEKTLGRERTFQYASRTVDLDILFFNDEILAASAALTVPHPRLHLRRFVLVPMTELAPGLVHPASRQTIAELLEKCPDQGEVTFYKKSPCISV
jgi:2-amino-4-hydroxy-6-hydroxymethyldihydropteridine diphosphokinase